MVGQPGFGMDHENYDWSPMPSRAPLHWPGDAAVALCVIINLEHYEWAPPAGSYQPPGMAGLRSRRPLPDYQPTTWREYGHRVGVFRVMEALRSHGIKATVAMDALTAKNYPLLVQHCRSQEWEFMGHGVAATQMITSDMPEVEEREYIRRSLDSLRRACDSDVTGWLGPEYGESQRTLRLLAEQGVGYVCDWVNDEQPYPMNVPGKELYALPIQLELDDSWALWTRHISINDYETMLERAFDTLYQEGATSGRLMVVHLHPWLIGQPYRIKYLRRALDHVMRHERVWAATGRQIIDWYRGQMAQTT